VGVEQVDLEQGFKVWRVGRDGFPAGVIEFLEEGEIGRVGGVAVIPYGLAIVWVITAC
jgi:hypothetical protein